MIEVQESELSKIHDTDTGKQSFYSHVYSSGAGYKVWPSPVYNHL